jgi:membrane protease YdiL (CAAX protease family)
MLFIIETFKLAPPTNVGGSSLSILIIVCTLVQLIGEELFKIILLILTMSLIYHFSKNRKLSIGISMIITMIVFGFAHAGAYGTFAQVLLIQGLSSIFDLYAYIKTKNVWVSYIAHVIFDFIPFALEILLIFM